MSKYGDVKDIKEKQWSQLYKYLVSNGIKIVELNLKTHVPSHTFIAGQPTTCYNCNEQGHHYIKCPYWRSTNPSHTSIHADSWAHAVTHSTSRQPQDEKERVISHMDEDSDIDCHVKGITPPERIDCMQSQCDLTRHSSNETLSGANSQIQSGECTQPLELVDSGREDTQDSDGMETGDEAAGLPLDMDQRREVNPLSRGDHKKWDHANNVQTASNYWLTKDPL